MPSRLGASGEVVCIGCDCGRYPCAGTRGHSLSGNCRLSDDNVLRSALSVSVESRGHHIDTRRSPAASDPMPRIPQRLLDQIETQHKDQRTHDHDAAIITTISNHLTCVNALANPGSPPSSRLRLAMLNFHSTADRSTTTDSLPAASRAPSTPPRSARGPRTGTPPAVSHSRRRRVRPAVCLAATAPAPPAPASAQSTAPVAGIHPRPAVGTTKRS